MMEPGMLWFDESKSTLEDKVKKAAAYFKKKYSKDATVCLVHASMMPEGQTAPNVEGITVKPWKAVVPSHLFLGVEAVIEKEVRA